MRKTALGLTILLALFVVGGPRRAWAAETRMWLTPTQGSYQAGDELTVTVNLDSAGETVVSADARLIFDPALLQAQAVSGSLADFSYVESINNTSGVVIISAIMSDIFSDGVVVNGAFAGVIFIAQSAGAAEIQLVFDPEDKEQDSTVATLNGTGDQLTSVAGASYTLSSSAAATATPTLVPALTSTPTPTPDSIGTLSAEPTSTPLPTLTSVPSAVPTAVPTSVAQTVSELPNSGAVNVTYLFAITGTLLLLGGARFVLLAR